MGPRRASSRAGAISSERHPRIILWTFSKRDITLVIRYLSQRERKKIRLSFRQRPPMPKVLSRTTCSRSEEHTSELQSRQYLVCRLLLEKKKHQLHYQLYN